MRVVVCGELNVDLIVAGLPELPPLGEERLAESFAMTVGGSGANTAMSCAALGMEVALVARVGKDAFAQFLRQRIAEHGLCPDWLIVDEQTPTGACVALGVGGERCFASFLGTISRLRLDDVDWDSLRGFDHLHVASFYLQKTLRPDVPELFRQARERGMTTSLDLGYDPEEDWHREEFLRAVALCDIVLPNETEICRVLGEDDPIAAARKIARRGLRVVVKRGGRGSVAVTEGEVIEEPAFSVDVVETTGCGDAFNAGFLYKFLSGAPLRECLRLGNAAGALVATRLGGGESLRGPEEVERLAATRPG